MDVKKMMDNEEIKQKLEIDETRKKNQFESFHLKNKNKLRLEKVDLN